MKNDTRYNGWTNYETWNVALWIDNDGSEAYWNERAEELIKRDADDATYALSKEIQEQIEEGAEDLLKACPSSMYADLLNASLRSVNWFEIAEKFVEQVTV